MEEKEFIIFGSKKIRRVLHNEEWFFSIVDIIEVLTDSDRPRKYWNKLNQRLREEGSESVTFCHQLKLKASDGKEYLTDCANLKGIFRIIQSVPSKKAEPLKRWLAKVGYDRIQEYRLKNNKKKAIKIASMVKHKVSTNFNFNRDNNYINFSVYTNLQRQALIASMVKHRSNESGLHRHLGSIPSQGASVFSIVGGEK